MADIADRFAALQPVYNAVIDRWGRLDADIARELALPTTGAAYRSLTSPAPWPGGNSAPPRS